MQREVALLNDIVHEAGVILSVTSSITWEQFATDRILTRAVLHSLMIIGEAANRIPLEVTSKHPSVPWRDLAGLRNRIVHDYSGIDLELVWTLITSRLPVLKTQIEEILRSIE